MKKTHTMPWDPAKHPETGEDIVAYLNVALEDGDLSLIMATLGDIARARGGSVVAQEMGLGRESLYKSLSADGNRDFATVLKVVSALGLRPRRVLVGVRLKFSLAVLLRIRAQNPPTIRNGSRPRRTPRNVSVKDWSTLLKILPN